MSDQVQIKLQAKPAMTLPTPTSTGLQDEEQTARDASKKTGYPYVNLIGRNIPDEILGLIPVEIAEQIRIVAFAREGARTWIATTKPKDPSTVVEILKLAKINKFEPALAISSDMSIDYALKGYQFMQDKNPEPVKPTTTQSPNGSSIVALGEEIKSATTSEILELMLRNAVLARASDIHVEPREKSARVRFRIDGILQDIAEITYDSYKLIRSRIKFLSKMKLDLSQNPQDGQFVRKIGDITLDTRVSSLPTVFGENLAMRLLIQEQSSHSLKDLGFNDLVQTLVAEAIAKPNGLVLNTGPTGSGKTTTLYAILNHLNKPGNKIITLEDPVEYRIAGINQSQIDPEQGYDFAEGMRSVVRQDPDIIMVGEMRDQDTVKTAIQAAQTGHLVLSTLHTNSAVAAMTRMLDMGAPPFLIPGTINLIIAQRLVRKICTTCKEQYTPNKEIIDRLKQAWQKAPKELRGDTVVPEKLWKGRGCDKCNNSGYLGRVPIAEALKPDSETDQAVLAHKTNLEVERIARTKGMASILEDGILKIIQGITTTDEVYRVSGQV
jgi:type IV pilus assembly protein PilB